MSAWWNLPFAVLVGLALWCRVGAADGLIARLGRLLAFFGVAGAGRLAAADFLGIAGVSGLLFVGWADQLAVVPDAWLVIDAVLSAFGLGLVGSWVVTNLASPDPDPLPGPVPREMPMQGGAMRDLMMMDVEELPRRSGGGSGSDAP